MAKLSVCTLALCLSVASLAHADSTVTFKGKGNSAGAFVETVADPCFHMYLTVQASEEISKNSTTTTKTKTLFVSVTGGDSCQFLSITSFNTLPLTVPIANQSTVTLRFDVMLDFANYQDGQTFQKRLVGSATITATGDVDTTRETFITQNESIRIVSTTKGTSRDATVTVTATLDGVPTSFVPGEGNLGNSKSSNIQVTHF